ncbi:hypothetical protein [Rathayibacter iranicus]|uniref:Uncharacterized protein n=1 Tax=Rathayibacter iranicus TaxID=59737 RepID=A0AAD2JFT8_9MICO|nr:hypothetical protein [Rathayibacter iranicus]AZZ54458.1 hypothetical protein C7V51_00040 [Rathayibacter iranicus]
MSSRHQPQTTDEAHETRNGPDEHAKDVETEQSTQPEGDDRQYAHHTSGRRRTGKRHFNVAPRPRQLTERLRQLVQSRRDRSTGVGRHSPACGERRPRRLLLGIDRPAPAFRRTTDRSVRWLSSTRPPRHQPPR